MGAKHTAGEAYKGAIKSWNVAKPKYGRDSEGNKIMVQQSMTKLILEFPTEEALSAHLTTLSQSDDTVEVTMESNQRKLSAVPGQDSGR